MREPVRAISERDALIHAFSWAISEGRFASACLVGPPDDEGAREVAGALRALGLVVHQPQAELDEQLDVLEQLVQPWHPGGVPPGAFGVVLTHRLDSGAGETGSARVHERMVSLLRARRPHVVLEWPARDTHDGEQDVARRLYRRALRIDYAQLVARAAGMARQLHHSREVVVGTDGDAVTFQLEPGSVTVETCKLRPEETLVQLPGGEVFARVRLGSAHGRFRFRLEGRWAQGILRDGVLQPNPAVPRILWHAPMVELGIGINWQVPPVSIFSVGEKSQGSVHFGFGDARIVGGCHAAPFHADLIVRHAGLVQRAKALT